MNEELFEKSARLQRRAMDIIRETGVMEIWRSVGAEPNLVGSGRIGLMMYPDIDLHIYSPELKVSETFAAIARLAENPRFTQFTFVDLADTDEACFEWHGLYQAEENETWKFDMIHILKGSEYDGYMEHVADRIKRILTPETHVAILRIKSELSENEKAPGIVIYQSVIRDGVRTADEFRQWLEKHPINGVIKWAP